MTANDTTKSLRSSKQEHRTAFFQLIYLLAHKSSKEMSCKTIEKQYESATYIGIIKVQGTWMFIARFKVSQELIQCSVPDTNKVIYRPQPVGPIFAENRWIPAELLNTYSTWSENIRALFAVAHEQATTFCPHIFHSRMKLWRRWSTKTDVKMTYRGSL